MSEFKISRLRFSWVGPWTSQRFYNKDQIVQFEGKAYVCLIPHTSNSFQQELENIEPRWELMMTGQTWRGVWTPSTLYSLDNIIIFGGIVYKCNTPHVSGVVLEIEYWDIYAESKSWQSEWTSSTTYGVGAIVQYGASVYECIVSHISAETDLLGLESDYNPEDSTLTKWKILKEGFSWKGEYATSAPDSSQLRYKLNDIVRYGPSLYRCIRGHAPSIEFEDFADNTVYNVTVASGTNEYGPGNKYYIDGFGGPSPTLNLIEGETYVFRQSDSSNATHPLRFSITPNGTWGGGVEYTEGVTIVGTAGQLGAYVQITVPVGAPTLYYYCVNHSGMGGTANTPSAATPTYDSVTSPASANEGDTVTFTVNTQNVVNGTTVGYTIAGIDVSDLSAGSLTGNITITSNTGTVSVTLANDETTEGTETMTLTLAATDSAGTSTGALSSSTIINDTSTTPGVFSTYAVTPEANSVDEGSSLTFNVATTDVDDATTLYWTVTNAGDFATSSGSFTITSNAGSFSVTPTADLTTEGPETFTASVRTGSTGGTIVATSSTVTINDTSTTPAFTPDYTITVTNSGNNYLLTGSDRNGSFSSSSQPTLAFNSGDRVRFNVNAGTSSAHPFFIKTTQSTGTGNQVSGVTGQGTTQLNWTTATAGAGSYGYQCSIHLGMWNTITIS